MAVRIDTHLLPASRSSDAFRRPSSRRSSTTWCTTAAPMKRNGTSPFDSARVPLQESLVQYGTSLQDHTQYIEHVLVLWADQITNYCMMQYGRVSMYRTSTLLDHPFQDHRYSPSWLVLMKTAWLAICCPHPPFLLYVVQCTFVLLMYSALSDMFCFFYWKSSLILCWVILCYNYFILQVLSQSWTCRLYWTLKELFPAWCMPCYC